MSLNIAVVTLFPEMVATFAECGIPRKAIAGGYLRLQAVNPRDFAHDVHRTVDDRPFGGGPGMVMTAPPLFDALQSARDWGAAMVQLPVPQLPQEASVAGDSGDAAGVSQWREAGDAANKFAPEVIYLSPQGSVFDQRAAEALAARHADGKPLILLAGRYEGIDERVIEREVDAELSIGDYVLSGGECAALVVIDAVARLIPGVLGSPESAHEDSFGAAGLLDHPHYTRPEVVDGQRVPSVLTSGDHARIRQWRREQALLRTASRRPDLLSNAVLDSADRKLLRTLADGLECE